MVQRGVVAACSPGVGTLLIPASGPGTCSVIVFVINVVKGDLLAGISASVFFVSSV